MKMKTDLWIMSHAMFLDWIKLRTLLEYRLNALLHREIEAIPFQDGDYWDVEITPVSAAEMELLLDVAEADEEDREALRTTILEPVFAPGRYRRAV